MTSNLPKVRNGFKKSARRAYLMTKASNPIVRGHAVEQLYFPCSTRRGKCEHRIICVSRLRERAREASRLRHRRLGFPSPTVNFRLRRIGAGLLRKLRNTLEGLSNVNDHPPASTKNGDPINASNSHRIVAHIHCHLFHPVSSRKQSAVEAVRPSFLL